MMHLLDVLNFILVYSNSVLYEKKTEDKTELRLHSEIKKGAHFPHNDLKY